MAPPPDPETAPEMPPPATGATAGGVTPQQTAEDLEYAVAAARLGTFRCDWPLDKIIWNETCKEHFFLPPDADVDFSLFYSLLHPDDREPTRRAIDRAMSERVEYNVEYRTLAPDGRTRWVNAVGRGLYGSDGVPVRFDGITIDISGRKAAEEALREADLRTAHLLERVTDAFFALDHQWRFTYVNDQAEKLLRRTRAELLGRNIWDEFPQAVGSTFERQYRRAVAEQTAVSFEEFYPPLEAWMGVRAYPSHDGLSVFFQNVNARRQAEAERERLLADLGARAEREALLNRIGQALRGSAKPEDLQDAAVRLLGEALGADRCYFAAYDLERSVVALAHDWHRAGLASIRGVYPFPNTVEMFQELYQSNTSVIGDARTAPLSAQTRANMEGLGLRARVSVALIDGEGPMATLTAAMADGPRQWTAEEVALIEAVATQLRTAVEMARVTQREHKIAEQLQAALQPAVPAQVPGLELADFYRPALEEAGVGGDFLDAFSADKGVTYLVVGDLSGKGLAAASEVATVRNMLRFALYNGRTLAGPITSLGNTLAEHGLLTGFATLFVGRYDARTRELAYVNCGQDAGLVLRAATGLAEALPPTGPVLGGFDGAFYTEEAVTLQRGDALALFTDGLTEAGPTRTALLTGDGVAALLEKQAGQSRARAIVDGLIAGVEAYALRGVRDDQCLLVGVVPPDAPGGAGRGEDRPQ